MGKIIHFPNAAQSLRGSNAFKPAVRVLDDVDQQIHLGPWKFTCHKCETKTLFESKNMIFRSVDFYCSSCGALHRVTNPAFSSPNKRK